MEEQKQANPYAIPIAILVAGLLVSGTIFLTSGGSNTSGSPTAAMVGDDHPTGSPAIENIKEVDFSEHIFGDPNAKVKIVEFSDLECPFCKRFHSTMAQVINEYGPSGDVAWVYRHFPLTSIHSKALPAAIATECAAEQGGNDAFWEYTNRYFEITPSNNGIDLSQLPVIAGEIGLNVAEFETCLESDSKSEAVQAQYQDAIDSGGSGTPYSVVIAANGKKFPILGAQPIEQVRATIEAALQAR